MLNSCDEAVPEANTATASPPDTTIPEIKAQAADAIFGPVPLKNTEEESTRRAPPLFERLLRYGPRATVAACLCGLAWVGGSYYSLGYSPFDAMKPNRATEVQQNAEHDEMLSTVREMAEEIRALKTSVEAIGTAQGAGAAGARNLESLKTQFYSVQTKTGDAIADLAGRVEKLESESTAKLSQLSEQLDTVEHQIATPHAASASAGPPLRKRVEHPHDAFDPSRDPTARGAPRPLGSLVNANPTDRIAH
jgi:flagellar biosynthesis/type III secretory pathway protein FliH